MLPSSQNPITDQTKLCGKLTTRDPDTYIVVCLHCLHYFRSLTDLLRHRLLNHNILDSLPVGESLPRISKDGSWLVAGGGDTEPQNPIAPTMPTQIPRIPVRGPSGMPTPSPPPPNIHIPQFRSIGPHHQMQNSQYQAYNHSPSTNRPVQSVPSQFSHGSYRPQNPYYSQHVAPGQSSPVPSPTSQYRPAHTSQPATPFSPAAREFVPSGMPFKAPMGDGRQIVSIVP